MVEKINRLKKIISKLLLSLGLAAVLAYPCRAGGPSVIADDETESLLHDIIRPIFNAAEIPFNPDKVYILNDESLNAFVSNGNYLFIHTGTLLNAGNVNEISGILAHEAGHIAGGHIMRQKLQLNKIRSLSAVSLIAATAVTAASGNADVALAVMLGSQSSLLNSLSAYQMQEERSADESAVQYLQKTGQSPAGLKTFMKKIQNKNRLDGHEEFSYFHTHPMNSERAAFFNNALEKSPYGTESDYDSRFQTVKAKLSAFLLPIKQAWRLYPETDHSLPARYAHAILHYRQNNLAQALKILDKLIASQPDNPYFYELKGQFLFESGKIESALPAYSRALQLRPHSPDIMLGWAQAALEAPHGKNQLRQIIDTLNRVQIKRPNLTAWLLLSRAYEEDKKPAEMLYAAAQYSAGIGNFDAARYQIGQAENSNPPPDLKIKLKDLKNALDLEEKL